MAINIDSGGHRRWGWEPELSRPLRQRIRQRFGCTRCEEGKKSLEEAIAIRDRTTSQQGEGITSVVANIPHTPESDSTEKQQGG